jgi:transposase
MSKPLRVRRITDEEGRQLQRIVRRGGGSGEKSIVKWRRALVVLASAGGNDVAAIARLVHTSPDRVRQMIHAFNDKGMKALDPRWTGGRPRRITTSERQLIVETARKRLRSLGQPFTRWSIRKLARYLATKKGHKVVISRERLRQVLAEEQITFQATKTWKESPDPNRDQKLTRIEHLLEHERDRTFAFDEFGPLAVKPEGGSC